MPILPLNIERFNDKRLLFVLTLQEYREDDYLTFFIDDRNELWFALGNSVQPFSELPAIATIALYAYLPESVRDEKQYQHVPMVHLIEDYLKVLFGRKIRKRV